MTPSTPSPSPPSRLPPVNVIRAGNHNDLASRCTGLFRVPAAAGPCLRPLPQITVRNEDHTHGELPRNDRARQRPAMPTSHRRSDARRLAAVHGPAQPQGSLRSTATHPGIRLNLCCRGEAVPSGDQGGRAPPTPPSATVAASPATVAASVARVASPSTTRSNSWVATLNAQRGSHARWRRALIIAQCRVPVSPWCGWYAQRRGGMLSSWRAELGSHNCAGRSGAGAMREAACRFRGLYDSGTRPG